MVFLIRELLIGQRTQAINALRGHLAEFGQIVPQGAADAARLIALVEDPDSGLPVDAIVTLQILVAALAHLETEIGTLDAEIVRRAKENDVARRLMTVPGIGRLIATAIAVLTPSPRCSARHATSHSLLLARSIMLPLRGKSTYPGCSDFQSRHSEQSRDRRRVLLRLLYGRVDSWNQQKHGSSDYSVDRLADLEESDEDAVPHRDRSFPSCGN